MHLVSLARLGIETARFSPQLERGVTVLRSHWNYLIKPRGTRKARMCCEGSKRAAPELRFA
jgi:hypothetical protein